MKYLSVLLLVLFTSACCGTKKAIETEPESAKEVETLTDTPKVTEIHEPINDDEEINKMVEIVDNNGITIAEVSNHEEAKELLEKQKDSINKSLSFNQNITKTTGYIHELFDELLEKNISEDGKVNYKGFKKSHKELLGYITTLSTLYPKLDEISQKEKIAYWINAYNALTIDLIIRNYPLESIKDIKDPWSQRLWKFGDKWQNLNDIEHVILRNMNEPRIHFAIVCASLSCPKLQNKAFTASNLETQLTNAAKEFLADTSKNELSENSIKISKIFKWFKKDFETDGSLIDFLNQYANITISNSAKKSYKGYSWELND